MSRLRHYSSALVSGYFVMAVNIVFTVLSVRLAFTYLGEVQFGLWALITQIAVYLALVDLGMSGAVTRILVDHKDDRNDTTYGSVVLTAFYVGLVQGAAGLAIGVLLACILGPMVGVPPGLLDEFRWLLMWQAVLLAARFVTQISNLLLSVHQRADVGNYVLAGALIVQLGVLWFDFARGLGLASLIWAQAAAQLFTLIFSLAATTKLELWPARGRWGRPIWAKFRELVAYGRDMFCYQIGGLFVNASQTVLISRTFGLEVGAVWSVCTRAFILIQQAVNKLFDASCPALAEMIVRGEKAQLHQRFRSLVSVATTLAVLTGIGFAFGNQPFVAVWMKGKVHWPVINDVLLAVWLVMTVQMRAHTGLAGLTKEFRALRYVYLLEGLVFVAFAERFLEWGGITAMICFSIAATAVFSFPYGLWRTGEFFGIPVSTVARRWTAPAGRLAVILAPLTVGCWMLVQTLNPWVQLFIGTILPGGVGVALLLWCGLDPKLAGEIRQRFTRWRQQRTAG